MKSETIQLNPLETKIYLIRGHKVMLDHDLAELYQVPTKRLNEQVRRNLRRFPQDFMFSLTDHEVSILRSQFAATNNASRMRRTNPLVFTEQGIAMLSSVLTSDRAADVNVAIMRTFVNLREVLKSSLTAPFPENKSSASTKKTKTPLESTSEAFSSVT